MTDSPVIAVSDWHSRQEGVSSQEELVRLQIAATLADLVRRLAGPICGRDLVPDDRIAGLAVVRLWTCVDFHWRRFAAGGPCRMSDVIRRLETGDLGYTHAQGNLLREIVLVQALELCEPRAAEMFEIEYMPIVRSIAARAGGARALDAIENFVAELILPRGERPPRIASFLGKTPLASWLRAVVVNYWISQARQQRTVSSDRIPDLETRAEAADDPDRSPCEELLVPVFRGAIGTLDVEDRLILKMLVLDETPQHKLALALGVNSGTLTRRRQRAGAAVLSPVREFVVHAANPRRAGDCLEILLTGSDPDSRRTLADVMAAGIRRDDAMPGGDP